jgi:hypothetical protein
MKTIIFRIFITAVLTLCVVNISSAEDCKNAEEMLSKTVSKNRMPRLKRISERL